MIGIEIHCTLYSMVQVIQSLMLGNLQRSPDLRVT